MELTSLEKAIKATLQQNPMQPALAALGTSQVDLPEEFGVAVDTLGARLHKRSHRSVIEPRADRWL